ncbi:MAG: elongation factor 4, partial [Acidobacteria bacterium]|nr:elongation factor 4 [Acidobacteriota bacterium]
VSRSLEACEGALLVVDASQGVEAQTLANAYLAVDKGLQIIPVVNKIDLPAADPDTAAGELAAVLGGSADEVLRVSAKTGEGIDELLEAIVDRLPAPVGDPGAPLRALVFDSFYDTYRGVVSHIRVVDGAISTRDAIRFVATTLDVTADEVGIRRPKAEPVPVLETGQVGYLITGVKEIDLIRVGDTVTHLNEPTEEALPGYDEPKPMVFAGLFPSDGDDFERLREALEKLSLNDSSLVYQPETSGALGFGFRIGFLGLLHMEIVRERLEREYDLDLITTAPSVAYLANRTDGTQTAVRSPQDLPAAGELASIEEPIVEVMIITPTEYVGTVMELVQQRRGRMGDMTYLSPERAEIHYRLPLAEMIFDFFDQLKSRTKGYASLDYEAAGYEASDLVMVSILLNGQPVDAFSTIVHRDKAYAYGKAMVGRLKELIPRQLYDVPVQAAIGSRIISRETIKAKRKDVTAKCYGGDITRKRKLLERQKEGKKRMKMVGTVEVPQEAFVAALSLDE